MNGNEKGLIEFDSYLINEWALFVQSKNEIVLNLYDINDYFKSLSKLIIVDVVFTENAICIKSGKALKETDSALKLEWFSLFPSLGSLKIISCGDWYAFRLDVFLEAMESISPTLSVIIEDANLRIQKAMTNKVTAQYHDAGWTMEYDEKCDGWWK